MENRNKITGESGAEISNSHNEYNSIQKELRNLKSCVKNFQSVFDNLSIGFIQTSVSGKILNINIAAKKILGVGSDEEIINKTIFKTNYSHKLSWDNIKIQLVDADSFEKESFEWRVKNGDSINVRLNAFTSYKINKRAITFNIFIDRVFDTDLIKTEQESPHSQYYDLFEYSPMATWEGDHSWIKDLIDALKREGVKDFNKYLSENPDFVKTAIKQIRVINVNQAAVALYKAKSKKQIFTILRERNANSLLCFLKQVMLKIAANEHSLIFKTVREKIDGEKFNVQIHWSVPPNYRENYSKIYITEVDVSELEKTKTDLKLAKENAEKENKYKSNFLVNMSHELRSPMNSIIGFAELLGETEYTDLEKNKYLKVIKDSSMQLLGLINDIIDLSRIEAGQLNLVYSNFDVHLLFDELQENYSGLMKKKGNNVRLINTRFFNKEFLLHTDGLRLRQLLCNLLDNAIKFTENGEIEFGYNIGENSVKFYVRDTGIGIPEDELDFVFKRYKQIDQYDNKNIGGTGLGLSITKNLVELMKGEIGVLSKPEKGSEFYFFLPMNNNVIS